MVPRLHGIRHCFDVSGDWCALRNESLPEIVKFNFNNDIY